MSTNPAVLYVEDDEGDRVLMHRAFAALGLSTALRTVPDGRSALQYLSGEGAYASRMLHPVPQVVILDLKLPQMSGFEVLDWIRRHPAHAELPVVIFSSSPLEEDRVHAKMLGASAYWEKPNSGRYDSVVANLRDQWLPEAPQPGETSVSATDPIRPEARP